MLKRYASALAASALAFLSIAAHAGTTTFTDRSLFQAALSSYTVDALNGMPGGPIMPGGYTTSLARPGYTVGGTVYTCHQYWDCGDNSAMGFSGDYMALFSSGPMVLTFDAPVKAFGLDYSGDPYYGKPGGVQINGSVAPLIESSGFFGVISTDALNSWSVTMVANGNIMIDNFTFGDAVAVDVPPPAHVPEPATALLLGVSAIGMVAARRRRAA